MTDQGSVPGQQGGGSRSSAERARLLAGVTGGALVAVFAVLNTDEVEVNWVFGTLRTPLIVVILVCLAIGLAVGLAGGRRGARAKKRANRS